ncbi:uncharacterized protein LOC111697300 [Eurytemora carolleeae]|uniref:uncharacterized protein LOC111697300 n=1 Tax=Eurytemora carolleeae TaxID=1294199 RepID=UPI000C77317E|nr:uncharacterized protein LOC111697300 [Eurytemora carolleeae]|eukprot:XP_023323013.1 uncharacterized protein LOC111697300 [Eurytemora affinis]
MVQFTNLRKLLISENWVPSQQVPVKDFSLCTFFDGVRLNLGKLENLNLSDWVLDISNPVDTINKLKRIFSSLPRLVSLVLDNYQEKVESTDSEKEYSETRPAPFFILKPCLKSLPNLARLSIRKVNVSREAVPMLAKALKYRALKNPVEVNVQFINSEIIEYISERLDSYRSVAYSYNKQTGILRIEQGDDTRPNFVQFSMRGGQMRLKMGGELVFSKSIRSTNL